MRVAESAAQLTGRALRTLRRILTSPLYSRGLAITSSTHSVHAAALSAALKLLTSSVCSASPLCGRSCQCSTGCSGAVYNPELGHHLTASARSADEAGSDKTRACCNQRM